MICFPECWFLELRRMDQDPGVKVIKWVDDGERDGQMNRRLRLCSLQTE